MSQAATAERVTSAFDRNSTALEVVAGRDLTGKTAIVTGGASGIGVETVRALAVAGAHVTIAARNLEMAQEVADKVNAEIGAKRVDIGKLELASLASVREFAKRWGDKPLNLLINNAGVMACPQGYTEDGFETQIGTNHLGHFLLASLLTPNLIKGAPSRVVSVSSAGHHHGDIDFEDPHFRKREYKPFTAYGQSKTANALFAVEYDRRYRDKGVRAFSLMPGMIATRLGRHMTPEIRASIGISVNKDDTNPNLRKVSFQTTEQGAATNVWAATAPELEGKGGLYLEYCAQAEPYRSDMPLGCGVMPHALDPENAKRLWILSEQEVGLA